MIQFSFANIFSSQILNLLLWFLFSGFPISVKFYIASFLLPYSCRIEAITVLIILEIRENETKNFLLISINLESWFSLKI